MLDDRRATVLRAVVQHYIETSQPVSSSSVVGRRAVTASSATVRNEMAALEREGFLRQPHTSAGRIPTDRGYRFFVDQLEAGESLAGVQRTDVGTYFAKASGELEDMLHQAGQLLSHLTGAASVVVGPDHNTAAVRSAQLVPLGSSVALAVLVLADGTVEKSTVEIPFGTDDATVVAASARLASHLDGHTLGEAPVLNAGRQSGEVDRLVAAALNALKAEHTAEGDMVYVGGASLLASAFDAVDVVRNVLTILEQQYVMVTLMRDLLDRGVTVSIGGENKVQTLSECSVVVAPTLVDGQQLGSVAVLGPTRMDYSQAMAAVTVVSQRLGERLGATRL